MENEKKREGNQPKDLFERIETCVYFTFTNAHSEEEERSEEKWTKM